MCVLLYFGRRIWRSQFNSELSRSLLPPSSSLSYSPPMVSFIFYFSLLIHNLTWPRSHSPTHSHPHTPTLFSSTTPSFLGSNDGMRSSWASCWRRRPTKRWWPSYRRKFPILEVYISTKRNIWKAKDVGKESLRKTDLDPRREKYNKMRLICCVTSSNVWEGGVRDGEKCVCVCVWKWREWGECVWDPQCWWWLIEMVLSNFWKKTLKQTLRAMRE